MNILILNGPNLNSIGRREPDVYGHRSFDDYLAELRSLYPADVIEYCQSNHEGALIDRLQEAEGHADGIILNAGAYTHTSIALLDALRSISVPVVEVHISNVAAREDYRRRSVIGPACVGTIAGFGLDSYRLAMEALGRLKKKN